MPEKTHTVWECELKKDPGKVLARLQRSLAAQKTGKAIRYPAIEDAEIPMAAEVQAEYRAGSKTRKPAR